MVVVISLLNEYWANTSICLLLSGSSCLQTSSPTVLSMSDDRHVNGNGEGKPCATAKQNGGRAALHVRFTGAVRLRRPLPVNCWMLVEWPKLTRFYNTKVTGGVIHLSGAVDAPEAKQREMLCSIKQGSSHYITNVTFLSLWLLIYNTLSTEITQ